MRRLASATFLALFALAGPTHAGETFDVFRSTCVDAHGNPERTIATAGKMGWKVIPDAMLQFLRDNYRMASAEGRMISAPHGTKFLLVAHKSLPSDVFTADYCLLVSMPAAEADLEKSIAAFAGVDSVFDPATGLTGYTWRVQNGVHVRVAQHSPDLPALAASGALNEIAMRRDAKSSVLSFIVPTRLRLSSGASPQTDTPTGQ
jgi:hypothetical protein